MKRAAFPPCGSCDLAIPDGEDVFCHGGPPGPFLKLIVVSVPGTNQQQQREVTASSYPPVKATMKGCALHPQHPIGKALRKLGRAG